MVLIQVYNNKLLYYVVYAYSTCNTSSHAALVGLRLCLASKKSILCNCGIGSGNVSLKESNTCLTD